MRVEEPGIYPLTFAIFILWPFHSFSFSKGCSLFGIGLGLLVCSYFSLWSAMAIAMLTDEIALGGILGALITRLSLLICNHIRVKPYFWPILVVAGLFGGLFYESISKGGSPIDTAIAHGGWQLLVSWSVIVGIAVMPHNQSKNTPASQAGTH
jgi:hypothetical protein